MNHFLYFLFFLVLSLSIPFSSSFHSSSSSSSFPLISIAIPTVNRASSLSRLLRQLIAEQSFPANQIFVFNDGIHPEDVKETLEVSLKAGVHVIQSNMARFSRLESTRVKSVRLAMLYKLMMDSLVGLEAPFTHVVIIEDDLVLAADFVQYFMALAAAELEVEEGVADERRRKVFCASAFNDNGFGVAAADEGAVRRGEHFMGLGWMISARIYRSYVQPRWPPPRFFEQNPFFPEFGFEWDDFIRLLFVEASRNGTVFECIYPEVPRIFHAFELPSRGSGDQSENPSKGTSHSTSEELQRDRLANLLLASGSGFGSESLEQNIKRLTNREYNEDLIAFMRSARHVRDFGDLNNYRGTNLVLVCNRCSGELKGEFSSSSADEKGDGWSEILGDDGMGLIVRGVDGSVRGIHQGVVSLRWLTNKVLISSTASPLYQAALQRGLLPERGGSSRGENEIRETLVVGHRGASCEETCATWKPDGGCSNELLPLVNDCDKLLLSLSCHDCTRGEIFGDNVETGICHTVPHRLMSCGQSQPNIAPLCPCIHLSV